MRYHELTKEEQATVDRVVWEMNQNGVGTVDLTNYQGGTGQRHRLRRAIEQRAGFKVDYGIDRDDEGQRFGWFERREERVTPEQQAARERLGFA